MGRQAESLRGYIFRTAAIALAIGCQAVIASAQDQAPAPTATPLPKSGTLASSQDLGYGDQKSTIQWGGAQLDGPQTAPLAGSVSDEGNGYWLVKVFNISKDSYTADIEVQQLNANNAPVKSDYFTISLGAGKSDEREVPSQETAANARVNLRSWKKTSSSHEAAAAPTATPVPPAVAGARMPARVHAATPASGQ